MHNEGRYLCAATREAISSATWEEIRVAEVGQMCKQRSPKCHGLPQKEGPQTILSQNLVLSRFMHFCRAFNESHPFGELSAEVSLLSEGFRQIKSACFQGAFGEHSTKVRLLSESSWRALNESQSAFGELSMKVSLLLEGFQRKSACFRRAFNESYPDFI